MVVCCKVVINSKVDIEMLDGFFIEDRLQRLK